MSNLLHYSKLALRDLDDIYDHIAIDLDNEQAAMRIVNDVMEAADKLTMFPLMGPELNSIVNIPSDYRFLVFENYLTFYHVEGEQVNIDRILYGRSNYLRTLFDSPKEEFQQ